MNLRKGFTFLELMLALAIVSIMAGAVVATWMAADRARRSIMDAVGPMRQGSTAIDFLRRDIESTLPVTGYLSYAFYGGPATDVKDSSDLQFFAAVDAPATALVQSDIRLVEYTLVADGSSNDLVRRVTSNLLPPTGENLPVGDQEVLCRGVRSLAIEYYDGTDWTDTWDSTQQTSSMGSQQAQLIPVALRVTLVLEPLTANGVPIQLERSIALPCNAPSTQPAGGL